jgi:hypothetical protein
MTVGEIAEGLRGTVVGGVAAAANDVVGGYVSDLLSDVMGHALEGDLWVTRQKHVNIVAVAQLKGLSGIVLVNGRRPEPDTLARAVEHGVPIVTTDVTAFDVAGMMYELGIRGRRSS